MVLILGAKDELNNEQYLLNNRSLLQRNYWTKTPKKLGLRHLQNGPNYLFLLPQMFARFKSNKWKYFEHTRIHTCAHRKDIDFILKIKEELDLT